MNSVESLKVCSSRQKKGPWRLHKHAGGGDRPKSCRISFTKTERGETREIEK